MEEETFSRTYLDKLCRVASEIDTSVVEDVAKHLKNVRSNRGRLFVLGVGGSAANASHLVNDFRKLAGIESYAPTDNVSELTARTNDDGWNSFFSEWLKLSNLSSNDCILILSVGGGNRELNISTGLCDAVDLAISKKISIIGIVGRNDGYVAQKANFVILVPPIFSDLVTPLSESFQAIIWHLLVSHPNLKINNTKW